MVFKASNFCNFLTQKFLTQNLTSKRTSKNLQFERNGTDLGLNLISPINKTCFFGSFGQIGNRRTTGGCPWISAVRKEFEDPFFIVDLLFYSWLLFSIKLDCTIRIQFKNVILANLRIGGKYFHVFIISNNISLFFTK